ncbi:hypothetical protein NJB18091_30110 [Mycobacterium marinum]|uniref:hypothetical protein n=1 Tax=Mycobacterium marinum TaxID=1781 RepID=UPI0021C2E88D|nr:hypothetical protein [Mycobacterium marinum]GJN99526.1 hypothetical protein NJB18091_30110 [Mycobacterium marinum]
MTAVAFTPAAGRYSVRFAYDAGIVALIKATVPGRARSWSAQERTWYVDTDWAGLLAAELVRYGHNVSGLSDKPSNTSTDTWAAQMFKAVGPQRIPAVHRALTKVLHPDTATGCPVLQRQLNDARTTLNATPRGATE